MNRRLVLALAVLTITISVSRLQAQSQPPGSLLLQDPSMQPPTESRPNISTKMPQIEDWTTISLAKSKLPLELIGGVPLSKVELQGCTRELLSFEWRRGDPIDVYVIRPKGTEKLPPLLYLFSYTAVSDIFREDMWCMQAKQHNIAVVGFISALAGQRFHTPRPMKQWFVSELQEALATSTHDVQMILNYLETRSDIDMKHVGIFGNQSGSSIAILAAAADPRIKVLDLVDPWGDWPDWLKGSKQIPENEREAYLKPSFIESVSTLDPLNYLPQLKDRSLRIEMLTSDLITPASVKDKIAAAVPPEDVIRFPDGTAQDKAWTDSNFPAWIVSHLKDTEPAKTASTTERH